MDKKQGQLTPYDITSPGLETEYTGGTDLSSVNSDQYFTYSADEEGFVVVKYSMWGFAYAGEENWNDEIKHINLMQSKLGFLDENIRRIRQHMSGLVCCDNGFPVTVDEILNIIGTGKLPEPAFRNGCWGGGTQSTQPYHIESMKIIEDVLQGFLNGILKEEFITKYPHVKGFITRTYKWLQSSGEFSELQRLLMKRMLLPFEYFTKRNEDMYEVSINCFTDAGEGYKLDKQIAELAGLPKIYPIQKEEYQETLNTIADSEKRDLYKICGNIGYGIAEISDCHHNAFRYVENWIYGIGTLKWGIPTRIKSSEEKRLGQLLLGYALGLDKWLQDIPHQFVLLDLGHIDLGFNPTNEILRVYAYLGDKRTPVKKWLAACLWHTLTLDWHSGLYQLGNRHQELIKNIETNGISVREWIDSNLNNKSPDENN